MYLVYNGDIYLVNTWYTPYLNFLRFPDDGLAAARPVLCAGDRAVQTRRSRPRPGPGGGEAGSRSRWRARRRFAVAAARRSCGGGTGGRCGCSCHGHGVTVDRLTCQGALLTRPGGRCGRVRVRPVAIERKEYPGSRGAVCNIVRVLFRDSDIMSNDICAITVCHGGLAWRLVSDPQNHN